MKITVTDCESGEKTTYDYSRDNWAKRWACMLGGLVHMWAPEACAPGVTVKTSGRLWQVHE